MQEQYLALFPQATLAQKREEMGTCEAWGYALVCRATIYEALSAFLPHFL